jgi:ATPase subunit of ABC transporter with duplicated ATPase domains
MARGRQKQLDRLYKMEALEQKELRPTFHFAGLPLTNTEHLVVKHLSVGYYYPILSGLDFSIKGGQKVVITGFNGIGKSTLLKTLIKQIPAWQGEFFFSEQVTLGYFEQDLLWEDETRTPIQVISDAYPSLAAKKVRKHLARCDISSKHAMQAIGTLSGGEQAKVKMCMLTIKPCNFLIMDEPTNHLDIQAKESLKAALSEFPGTVLLVSHEQTFYRDWAQRIINIEKSVK